jgi:hypothetical protein
VLSSRSDESQDLVLVGSKLLVPVELALTLGAQRERCIICGGDSLRETSRNARCAEPGNCGKPELPSGHAGEVKSAAVVGFRASICAGSGGRPHDSLGHTRSKETYSCDGLDGGGGDGRRGFPSSFVSNICISLFNCSYRIDRSLPLYEGSPQCHNVLLRNSQTNIMVDEDGNRP